jgi:hypothetical protein
MIFDHEGHCHRPSDRALSRLYKSDKHAGHVTASRSSVAMPSISARWAASLSRLLHTTAPSSLKACRSRFCLVSLDIGRTPKERRKPKFSGGRFPRPLQRVVRLRERDGSGTVLPHFHCRSRRDAASTPWSRETFYSRSLGQSRAAGAAPHPMCGRRHHGQGVSPSFCPIARSSARRRTLWRASNRSARVVVLRACPRLAMLRRASNGRPDSDGRLQTPTFLSVESRPRRVAVWQCVTREPYSA